MEDLFSAYWWLLFPLSCMAFGFFQAWLKDRARRDVLEVLKSYARAGREPPPELVAKLNVR